MSYANFKPTIWSHFIQTELEKKCKLIDDCNRQFEGEARLGAAGEDSRSRRTGNFRLRRRRRDERPRNARRHQCFSGY